MIKIDQKEVLSSPIFFLLLGLLFIVYLAGLFIPIMEIDAAQYASISWEMLHRNSFLQVTDGFKDYLDKPPLLFWLSAFSIHLFGNSSWAFKLPSVLASIASWYALYRIAKHFYGIGTARTTILVYATCISSLIMLNDIRTDTLLLACIILCIWQALLFFEKNTWLHLILASFFAGCAMLAKGPIGLLVPILALVPHYFFTGKVPQLFRIKLLAAPIIILLVLSPMLYGLCEQFGWEGIHFFFWKQSFGRITGENVWKNDASSLFFVHTLAWSILPWTLYFVRGLLKSPKRTEYLSLFGFLLPFLALSQSHYKLPHYIYVVSPFVSIIVARALHDSPSLSWQRIVKVVQSIVLIALILAGSLILIYVFPANTIFLILALCGLLFLSYLVYQSKQGLFIASIAVFIWLGFLVNFHGYPSLLLYQSQSEVAFHLKENNIPVEQFFTFNTWGRTINYYNAQIPLNFSDAVLEKYEAAYVYIKEPDLAYFQQKFKTEITATYPHINVTRLSLPFLIPSTRSEHYETRYLIKVKAKQ